MASAAERKEKAARWSIAASAGITLAKGAAGLATGSLALVADAAHSLLDVASTTLTWLAVRASEKPADAEHQYGHGKVEALAALVQTALLFLVSGAVAYEGLRRLATGASEVSPNAAAVVVLLVSMAVDAWRWHALRRVARETGSQALEADALHFSADLVNSALVLAALAAAAAGYTQADAIVAIGVSLFIAGAGFRLTRRTIDTLLDAAPAGLAERIEAAATAVPGVAAVGRVRVRPVGGRVQGETLVKVSRTLPLEHVAELREQVRQAITAEVPGAEVTVGAEPVTLDEETVLERVLLIGAKQRLPVHHVVVQEVEGRRLVSADVEVDGRLSLGEAHELASRLEAAIREELGPQVEVDTHIEPLQVEALAGIDATEEELRAVKAGLGAAALESDGVSDVHSVRVRRTGEGLVVHFHCRVDPARSVASAHAEVDALERRFRSRHPGVVRIVGHAEPTRPHPQRGQPSVNPKPSH
jgi:cation diffusion facilitator family transporter